MAAKSASAILSSPGMQARRAPVQRMAGPPAPGLAGYKPQMAAKPMMGQAAPAWAPQMRMAGPPGMKPGMGAMSPFSGQGGMSSYLGAMNPAAGRPGLGGTTDTFAAPLMTGGPSPAGTTTTAAATAPPGTNTGTAPGVIETPATGGQGGIGPTDPWGYPTQPPLGPKIGRKGHKKFGGHGYAQRAYRKLPPWLQDPTIFNEMTGGIAQILGQQGHLSPELLQRQQADIESGGQQSQQALLARLAAAGVDPSSPMALSMAGTIDQARNRLQHTARANEDIRAAQQWRQDLSTLPIPLLQAILGFTTKKGGGGVTPTGGGGGGGGSPDYLGALSNIAGSVLGGWAQGGFQT